MFKALFETRYSTASDVTVRAMEDIIEDMLTIAEDGLLGVDDLAAWRRSGKKAFVVKRGPLTLMLKVSSIMSGVTVSSVTFLLMPALFISRFRPPAPTLDSTNFLASSIVFISLTSSFMIVMEELDFATSCNSFALSGFLQVAKRNSGGVGT